MVEVKQVVEYKNVKLAKKELEKILGTRQFLLVQFCKSSDHRLLLSPVEISWDTFVKYMTSFPTQATVTNGMCGIYVTSSLIDIIKVVKIYANK